MKKGLLITGIILLVILGVGTYAYNTIISPHAEKPTIAKPSIPSVTEQVQTEEIGQEEFEQTEIEEEHIQYLVNEIGGYNLHDDPVNDEPAIMQFDVMDVGKSYIITIENNFPIVEEGETQNPDIILHANQDVLVELLSADDFNAKTVELIEAGDMWMEIIADETTLALKGYKSVYDQVTAGDDNGATANVIRSLDWP